MNEEIKQNFTLYQCSLSYVLQFRLFMFVTLYLFDFWKSKNLIKDIFI